MKLDFNIGISQRQGLTLTLQVQQAIKLLHMTNLEVNQYIEENFLVNPFVDIKDNISRDDIADPAEPPANITSTSKSMEETPFGAEARKTKTEIENQFETGESYRTRSTVSKEHSDFDPIQLLKAQDQSIFAYCGHYIDSLNLPAAESIVAYNILGELAPTGWLDATVDDIASKSTVGKDMVEAVLQQLQMIEPAGLFARSLVECLTLQAHDRGLLTGTLASLLSNLHLLGSGKFDLLKRRCGLDDLGLAENLKVIKSLDPKPGLKFSSEAINIREPDLKVSAGEDGWIVTLNKSTLPSVEIHKDYGKSLLKTKMHDEQREFVKEKILEANWLKNALQKRSDTMLRVGSEIVKRQTEFLTQGPNAIKPMVLRDIAEAVDMHESTISRVTTGSLMETPQGTIELKAFFSVALPLNDDLSSQSSASVKFKVKKLIETEAAQNPVSDDEIVEKLKIEGINVARRTVAKYRKIQNIPASFMRKRQSTLSGMI